MLKAPASPLYTRAGLGMSKKKRFATKDVRSRNKPRAHRFIDFEITDEPIIDRQFEGLPTDAKDAFERLYTETQKQPLKAIPELLEWIEKYPDLPMLRNWLSAAYSASGQDEKAKEAVKENYLRNPNYLFARINYAEQCLTEGDSDMVGEIFNHTFDLKLLYPERNRFHVTEAACFMGLIGLYLCETGAPDLAESLLIEMEEIAPDYPTTRKLRLRVMTAIF
jgi:tetratricopeptide (TPR) repeat protein